MKFGSFIGIIILCVFTSFSLLMADDSDFDDVVDWAWHGKFNPFIELTSGALSLKHQKFSSPLPEHNGAEVKLGYSQIQEFRRNVWEMDERFVFGSYIDKDVPGIMSTDENDLTVRITRFGFGNRMAYGYQFGKQVEFLPYFQNGLVWTKIKTDRPGDLSQEDSNILDRYEGVYRFGMHAEGGIKLQLFNSLGLVGSYELGVVYPRHIFWPWVGSNMIMQIGMGLISAFGDDIVRASPSFGPIFYFLLKNGLAYGFYQGVKEKMNWPFNSETPMTLETVKLGISFTF